MIDSILLFWRFFLVQPPLRYIELVPWHLLALLFGLGVLAAVGLHFLVGHTLGFYRRGDRILRWLSLPTLVLWVGLVQALLGAYLLASNSESLIASNLNAPGPGVTAERIGAALLAPAFAQHPLNQAGTADITREVILAGLGRALDLEYRQALSSQLVPPADMPSQPGKTTEGIPAETGILVQLALRWVLETPLQISAREPAENGAGAGTPGLPGVPNKELAPNERLPMYLVTLVSELQPGVAFPRKEWEYVTGSNFINAVMGQVLEEWLRYLALALTLIAVFIFGVFFLTLRWIKGLGRPSTPSPSVKARTPSPRDSAAAEGPKAPATPASVKPSFPAPASPSVPPKGNGGTPEAPPVKPS